MSKGLLSILMLVTVLIVSQVKRDTPKSALLNREKLDILTVIMIVHVQHGSFVTHRTFVSVEMNTAMKWCVTLNVERQLF